MKELVYFQAIKSPLLQYSHFVSIPLALHPKLLESVIDFQKSLLESGASSSDGGVNYSFVTKALLYFRDEFDLQFHGPQGAKITRSVFLTQWIVCCSWRSLRYLHLVIVVYWGLITLRNMDLWYRPWLERQRYWQVHFCKACHISFDTTHVKAVERRSSESWCRLLAGTLL